LYDAVESLRSALEICKDLSTFKEHEPQPNDQVNTLLKFFIKILNDPQFFRRMIEMFTRWMVRIKYSNVHIVAPLRKRHVGQVKKERKIGRELKMARDI
jgi:hypothetical protein